MAFCRLASDFIVRLYSGLNLNQDKATKPQTVQIVRQGEATPYWFKVNPLYFVERPSEKSPLLNGAESFRRPSDA